MVTLNFVADLLIFAFLFQPKKTYFKRGDLAAKEQLEYEKKHNIKRISDDDKPSTSTIELDSLNTIAIDEEKLPMTLSRQEVTCGMVFFQLTCLNCVDIQLYVKLSEQPLSTKICQNNFA